MPCALTIDPTGSYIEASYSGLLSFNDLLHSRQAILTMARSQPLDKLLVDKQRVTGGFSIGDLFLLVNWLALQQDATRIREAVLRPASASMQQCCEFWETACTNRRLSVRIFDHEEQAIPWLIAAKPAQH
jgi:hypothetical protein